MSRHADTSAASKAAATRPNLMATATRPRLLVLGGVTASGKTQASLTLARHLPMEVVSADSVCVYRGLDIGSAKPTRDEQASVPHHLIDVVDPDEAMTAALFSQLAREAIAEIVSRGHHPVLVGGTGLYIRATIHGLMDAPKADEALRRSLRETEQTQGPGTLHAKLQEVDPETATRLHPSDLVRIVRALEVHALTGETISQLQRRHQFSEAPYEVVYVVLDPGKEVLDERIQTRVEAMWEAGLLDEARRLLSQGYSPSLRPLDTPGYRQAFRVIAGDMPLEEAKESMATEHRRYARRQRVWFRGVEDALPFPGPHALPYEELAAWLRGEAPPPNSAGDHSGPPKTTEHP